MKLLIVALNAKYTHTSLSARCLFSAVKNMCDCSFKEYTINDSLDEVASDIYSTTPQYVAFSCYIWNIEAVLKIASLLKKADPCIKIILGGHEVEHDCETVLKKYDFVDFVLRGEGEVSLKNFVLWQLGLNQFPCFVTYREDKTIVTTPNKDECVDLNELPFVYDETIESLKNRIIYYESSRGCPYSCTYCISGEGHKVRFLNVERVKKELAFFIEHKVPLVKFVDRTFNADKKRADEIFKFIADNPSDTCFHMELAGNLIDNTTLEILSKVKKGTMQFEIGVQTTNPHTMKEIERNVSFDKLRQSVKALVELGNIPVHLDLIAGLPFEDFASFRQSFNDVIALNPTVLQLGFLKLLKGSKIRNYHAKHGYVFRDYPPYEVVSNRYISYGELLKLKSCEDALERYYNSGCFCNSLCVLYGCFKDRFEVFIKIGEYIKANYPTGYAFSRQALYDVLYECFKDTGREFLQALKKDYLVNFRPGKRPYWFDEAMENITDYAYTMFKDEEYKKTEYPFYYDVPAKEIMKNIYCEKFDDCVLLFDYKRKCIYDVTDYFQKLFFN